MYLLFTFLFDIALEKKKKPLKDGPFSMLKIDSRLNLEP
jgi:hypothetical protein